MDQPDPRVDAYIAQSAGFAQRWPTTAKRRRRSTRSRPAIAASTWSEAKREQTRQRRLVQAIEWLAEGKPRNWKYMNC